MKKRIQILVGLIAHLVVTTLNAQITVVNNGTLTIKDNQIVHINGDLSNYSSQFSNRGDIGLTGNLLNEVSVPNPGAGIFRFIGFQQQKITLFDTMSMFNVTIANMDGLLMDGINDLQVFGNMGFKDGIAYTNASSMIAFREQASTNNGNSFSYINGPALKYGENDFVFPVGKNGYFRPAAISEIADQATYLMEYFHEPYFTDLKNFDVFKVDDVYWNLQKISGVVDPKLSIVYDASSDRFPNPENISIVHFANVWQTVPSFSDGASPIYSLVTQNHITNYGKFTIAQKQGELVVNLYQNEECEIQVTWVMPRGTLIKKYQVEYSYDSLYFSSVGEEVLGSEEKLLVTTGYELIDPTLHEASRIFYRVKMFTTDSIPVIAYTPTASIENNCQFEDCILFPNPVSSDADLKFQVTSEEAMVMPLQVYDVLGRFLFNQTLNLEEGKHIYDIYIKKYHLPASTYFLYVNPEKSLKFVVIQK